MHAGKRCRLRATLDEMVGLGVLLRTPDGRYRLRSPNVVRLLGSIDDVEHRLLEFAGRPPVQTQQDILDRQRPMLRTKSGECGALTQAQERLLITPRLGVGLIFGSPALGLTALSDSIHRAFIGGGPIDGEDAVARRNLTLLPSAIVTGEELGRWLVQHVREHPPTKGDVIMQVVADGGDSFNDRVEAAIDVVRKPGLLKPRLSSALPLLGAGNTLRPTFVTASTAGLTSHSHSTAGTAARCGFASSRETSSPRPPRATPCSA